MTFRQTLELNANTRKGENPYRESARFPSATARLNVNVKREPGQPKLRSETITAVGYSPAKRNHYNPCFWTALWNQQFLDRKSTRLNSSH